MITAIRSNDRWTGTRGRQPEVVVVHSPEKECDLAIRAAQAAIADVIKKLGPNKAGAMTVNECVEKFLNL